MCSWVLKVVSIILWNTQGSKSLDWFLVTPAAEKKINGDMTAYQSQSLNGDYLHLLWSSV